MHPKNAMSHKPIIIKSFKLQQLAHSWVIKMGTLNNLKYIHKVDKHAYLMEMTYGKFIKKWMPYNQLVA